MRRKPSKHASGRRNRSHPKRDDEHQLPALGERNSRPLVSHATPINDHQAGSATQGVQHLAHRRWSRLEVAVSRPAEQRQAVSTGEGIDAGRGRRPCR